MFYDTEPEDDAEIIRRIADADAVFVSYNRTIGAKFYLRVRMSNTLECAAAYIQKRVLMWTLHMQEHME